jgi:hypothetical protein
MKKLQVESCEMCQIYKQHAKLVQHILLIKNEDKNPPFYFKFLPILSLKNAEELI